MRSWMARMRSFLRASTERRRLEEEMNAELADHLERLTADLVAGGCPEAEAARRARIAMGPALMHKEGMRASVGLHWIDELRADLRFALRLLRRDPRFALVGAASLALAIGANSTIFAAVKQMLYTPLAVPQAEQLRLLRWVGDGRVAPSAMWGDFDSQPGQGTNSSVFSYPVYQEMRRNNHATEDLVGFKVDGMNATVRGVAQRVSVEMVSGNYYTQMRIQPQIGRALEEQDDATVGAGAVAVISDELWERGFDRSPAALGQTITLNQTRVTVVGVNPRSFTGLKTVQQSPEIFVPLSLQPAVDPKGKKPLQGNSELWWLNVMARTKPGVADTQAAAALDVALQAAVRATMTVRAGDTMPRLMLVDGSHGLRVPDRTFRMPLYVLWALAGFVLLLACANVANLLLARGTQRKREMSVRLALGAGRERVLRQMLTESLLLAVLGGAGGLLLGYLTRNVLPSLLTQPWQQATLRTQFDWKVFGFTALVTLGTGVLFGSAPAWVATRAEISSSLKESALQATRRRKGVSGKAVVAFQIALSTILVVGAGMFLRTIWSLDAVDVGFKADHLLLMDVEPPARRYPAGKDVELHKALEQRVAALPGVESVSVGSIPYLSDSMSNSDFLPEGQAFDAAKPHFEDFNVVGSHFFETLGIPIVAGRGFNAGDTASSTKVAVVNEKLARKAFPGANAIGKRFRDDRDGKDWIEVVGICRDTYYSSLRQAPPPQFFLPLAQQKEGGGMVYQVRTHMTMAAIAPALRRVVQQVDPDLPLTDMRTQREQIQADMQLERAVATLTTGFGVLALLLAGVGIYGVMAYSVAQRTNEIGIRLALGAPPRRVRRMVLRETLGVTWVGLGVGLGVALVLTRLVKSMLYGIAPHDPLTVASSVLLLLAVSLAASWIPARRAAGVQPMEALRHE